MKTKNSTLLWNKITILVSTVILFTACNVYTGTDAHPATLAIQIGTASVTSRTVLPSLETAAYYSITLTPIDIDGATVFEQTDIVDFSEPIGLIPGTWNILVRAHTSAGGVYASASSTVDIETGVNSLNLVLEPLRTATGEGTIDLYLGWHVTDLSYTIVPWPIPAGTTPEPILPNEDGVFISPWGGVLEPSIENLPTDDNTIGHLQGSLRSGTYLIQSVGSGESSTHTTSTILQIFDNIKVRHYRYSSYVNAEESQVYPYQVEKAGWVRAYTRSTIDTVGTLTGPGISDTIEDDDGSINNNFLIIAEVVPGSYDFEVKGYSTSIEGAYELIIEFQTTPFPTPPTEGEQT